MEIAGNDANARLACQNRCVVCGRSCLRHTFYLSLRTEQAVCFRFPFLFKQILLFFDHHPAVRKILHRTERLFLFQKMVRIRPLP